MKLSPLLLLGLGAIWTGPAAAAQAAAQEAPLTAAIAPPPVVGDNPGAILVESDTLVRLMVVNEVSTRKARPGDRFVLRVDEDVVVNGVTVIPVGTRAWGEVVSAEKSGAVGKAGKLAARLLHIDLDGQAIALAGDNRTAGQKGTAQVVMGVLGPLGPLGLLAPGNSGRLKAGEIFNGEFASDMIFDSATRRLTAVADQPPAPLVIPAQ